MLGDPLLKRMGCCSYNAWGGCNKKVGELQKLNVKSVFTANAYHIHYSTYIYIADFYIYILKAEIYTTYCVSTIYINIQCTSISTKDETADDITTLFSYFQKIKVF